LCASSSVRLSVPSIDSSSAAWHRVIYAQYRRIVGQFVRPSVPSIDSSSAAWHRVIYAQYRRVDGRRRTHVSRISKQVSK